MDQRTILHIDMNAFFASVEQTANPFIRHKPVGVGNPSYANTALVAISYEAKKRGVPKLSRAREARQICPDLIVVPFDPLKYYAVNRQIIAILREYTPLVEVYSIDEAFLDLTPVLHLYNKTPPQIAQEIKDRIRAEVGSQLGSSVGIAPNKLLAKIASNWKKPDGLTVITWENRFEFLDKVPIQDIWGIGFRTGPKLVGLGINSTKQLRDLSDAELRTLFGSYYTRLRLIANGHSYDPVSPERAAKPHKSMQHAHTLSRPTQDAAELKTLIRKLSEKLARRLRKYNQRAHAVYLGSKPDRQKSYGWGSPTFFNGFQLLDVPSNHGKHIYDAACQIMEDFKLDKSIRLVVVGVHHLLPTSQQIFSLLADPTIQALDSAVDTINRTYGEFTIRSGDILHQKAKESELHVDREDMTFHPAGGH